MIGCKINRTSINPIIRVSRIVLLVAASVFAAGLGMWSMSSGIGVSPDSVVYISAANSVSGGRGLTSLAPHSFPRLTNGKPLTIVPPTYPLLIALSNLIGSDQLISLRWLHSLFFGINVLLLGMIVYQATNGSVPASFCSSLLFLASPTILEIHTMAWSEPPFILFALSAALLLILHIKKPNKSLLIGSALSAALAMTTRYAGVALLPPMLLTVLLLEDRTLRDRIRDCLILLGASVSPLAFWLIRNIAVADSSINRSIAFHPISVTRFNDLIDSTLAFTIPLEGNFYLKTALLFLFVGLVIAGALFTLRISMAHKKKADANPAGQLLAAAYLVTYLLLLFVSVSLIDSHTPLDGRILSPVYVFGIILVFAVAHKVSHLANLRVLWWGFLVLSFALISLNAIHAFPVAASRHNEGSVYANHAWRDSASMRYIRSLPENKIIYSNGTDAIYFLTTRTVLPIPARVDPGSGIQLTDFEKNMNAMCTNVTENGALIVYLDSVTWRWYLPSKEELERVCKAPVADRLADGTVYGSKSGDL